MSYAYSARENKDQKHPKVSTAQYLFNTGEPKDDASNDSLIGIEAELLENSFDMRQDFRRYAQRIRGR